MKSTELEEFGRRYAAAWCSQDPDSVAGFFSEGGSLRVNEDAPAVGRADIAEVARGFMTAFPDMVVAMDRLEPRSERTAFHWTLTGTNTGPDGTGQSVRISGHELWSLGADGLIEESRGHFDATEYARQLEYGIDR